MNILRLGDCLEVMKDLHDGSIDMVLADPPYEITACKWDSLIPLEPMWEHLKRVIKPNGVIVLSASQPFTTTLISSNVKMFKYCWYWEKNQGTNFFHCKRMPIRYVEELVVFYKPPATYIPQMTTGHPPTNSATGSNTGKIYHGKSKVNRKGGYTTRFPKNILKFKKPNNYHKLHPTQKPLDMMEYMVKTYTNKGQMILDFCMGSGTTGVACKKLNRNFIGIEKDPKYFEIAKQRINNE